MVITSPVSHNIPVDENTDGGETNIHTNDHIADKDPVADQVLVVRSRFLLHDVSVGRVKTESSGRGAISDQVNPQKLDRVESFRDTEHGSNEDGSDLTNVGRDQVTNESLHVTVDSTTLFNSLNNCSEVVISKNHIRSLLGNLSTGDTHSNTNVSLFESRCIINTITSHSNNVTHFNEVLNKFTLVARLDSGEDLTLGTRQSFFLLFVVHLREFNTSKALSLKVSIFRKNFQFFGNGDSGLFDVTSDHDNIDTGSLALSN
mmetsp:Transcript_83071/g.114704  ORF Transcript_83071/g.114704 Transcript_83071/m.114704 type:complete len:260 (+) Transcript_83071:530-1309(+)